MVMLIDSHCHLEMPDFRTDLDKVLQRAKDSGVGYIFTIGTEERDWNRAVEIAEAHASVHAVLGIHPHNAKEIDDQTYVTLKKLCGHPKVKAVGEMGLDFFRNLSPRDVQLKRFQEQIKLAREIGLPIVVHDREAHRETLEVLKSEGAEQCGGIIHCFSGDDEMARRCIDMGFYISLPGSLTYKNADRFREIVKRLPLESLLVETDAPFLSPVPLRGKRNEPAHVRYTAEKLAEVKGISFEKVAEVTTENALRVYRLTF
jgi:TatD DNase family protein